MTNFLFHLLAWPIWAFFLITPFYCIFHLPVIKEVLKESNLNIHFDDRFPLLVSLVVMIALSEGLATLFFRYFALARPVNQNRLSIASVGGRSRFFFVSLVNWFISSSISAYGVVLFIMSNEVQFLYFFAALGVSLMIIHVPRLYSFEIKEEE